MKNVLGRCTIKTILSMIAVLIVTVGGLSACAQNQATNSQTPIVIGVSLSFYGDFKDDGLAMKQGYQLWADTVNNNGGLLGRPV
jgi:branched-chain amino acid transport system substrate-binding protein